MKLLVVAAILGVCLADRLDNKYLPPRGNDGSGASSFGNSAFRGNSGFGGGFKSSSGFGQGSSGFGASGHGASGHGAGFGQGATQYSGNVYNAPAQQYNAGQQYNTRAQASADANAQILRSNSEVTAEGFAYDFETSNGIRADASGVATNGVQSHGSFGYKGDDGQDYSITYTADENGYQPQGAHLPTPPPIPEEILRSLEQNARDEAAGISDDGSYHGEGAGSGNSGYSAYSRPSGPSGPSNGGSFGGASNFGGHSNFGGASNFGGSNAASRQYLAPKAGPRPSGSGNFNAQSGYRY